MQTGKTLVCPRDKQRLWTKKREVFTLVLIALIVMVARQMPAFASTANDQKLADSIFNGLSAIYSIMIKVVLPIAGVCVAGCAFTIWLGGEKGMEKAKRILLFTVMGVAVVFLAPAIIVTARNTIFLYAASLPYTLDTKLSGVAGLSAIALRVWIIAGDIVLPLACVSVAYGGMCFFGMDILSQLALDRQIEKGKTIIRTTLIAALAFYLVPTVLVLAINTFSGSGWDPASP